jgi:hypothetical protein
MKTITKAMIEYFQLFNLYVDKIEELKKQIEQDKK